MKEIDLIKPLILKIRKSNILTKNLRLYQIIDGIKHPKNILNYNITRWNSTYLMIERFVELKQYIIKIFNLNEEVIVEDLYEEDII